MGVSYKGDSNPIYGRCYLKVHDSRRTRNTDRIVNGSARVGIASDEEIRTDIGTGLSDRVDANDETGKGRAAELDALDLTGVGAEVHLRRCRPSVNVDSSKGDGYVRDAAKRATCNGDGTCVLRRHSSQRRRIKNVRILNEGPR
jgi:hypothetical protein